MKKQIISLGALAVASSLFTWDNKADAIVTKDYSGKSQVNAGSKNGKQIADGYYWGIIENLENQFYNIFHLLDQHKYAEKEYKDAVDKLKTRVLEEDQYLLERKKEKYEIYKELYKKYKKENPNTQVKMKAFDKYDLGDLTMEEYNDLSKLLTKALDNFKLEVKKIESENPDLKPYSESEERTAYGKIDSLVDQAYSVYFAYVTDAQHKTEALNLRAKIDLILGDEKDPIRVTNQRTEKEMIKDLESIIDDFFIETKLNRPKHITRYDGTKHDYHKHKDGFDALVKETREAVAKADESWKNKTVKKYGETETKSPVVKEEKKVEEPQAPKVDNQQEVKTTAGKAEETTQPVAQPLVKIPQGTIYGETVKGPDYPTMENKTLQGVIVQGPDFPTMEQSGPSLSNNYTNPPLTNPILEGLEGSSSKLEIKPQGTESTLKGTQGESSDIEVKPQASETTEASHYPARPQFNKTPKYVKYRDAGTGIREYNDGTFGYEARPRFNKPSETNAYNVTTNQDGTVTYGARPTQNKASKTNAYNVTTHANGQVSYGARPTYKKPSETNAYNVTTHANGQVSYGARPTQNKPSKTNAYNVTTHGNGQVSYGARPTQNKPSKTNAYNVTTHANGQVSYGARPTYKKPSETNAYNVTTHADGTATYGPRVTK
ncbi:TPA: staphylocoagulase [Staphylococcus aureus]|uniref:staphylocoagulase n=5 Tax=Staphylococcus aureus TaxID=1280 RepID=UPI0002C602F9|nr:staphylocoagulase [Staphylococcus aureus]EJX2088938.1 staphylocoagulase [Staphylococcus aureus]ELN9438913.1 staphylocoagulase [Staphylococcus aureus]EMS38950.1 Staphylocoagulase [Staphylococcus aureus KLT6]MBA5948414.1 staphylocoagulase [Staphylococcus aureus]MBO2762260.1 staphylocoagulase [Staphylococcus aureus]